MARWAIGDMQGCCEELEQLLARIRFSQRPRSNCGSSAIWSIAARASLQALRLVRSWRNKPSCVLGNHDLHLLAVALVRRTSCARATR